MCSIRGCKAFILYLENDFDDSSVVNRTNADNSLSDSHKQSSYMLHASCLFAAQKDCLTAKRLFDNLSLAKRY